jgi:hypothetical protein
VSQICGECQGKRLRPALARPALRRPAHGHSPTLAPGPPRGAALPRRTPNTPGLG